MIKGVEDAQRRCHRGWLGHFYRNPVFRYAGLGEKPQDLKLCTMVSNIRSHR